MNHVRIVQAFIVLFLLLFLAAPPCPAAQQTLTKTVAGPTWLLDDNPPPKTYWAPWYPMPTQALVRYGMGFRVSTGAVAVRCPVKVTVRWDDAQAKGGETLVLHVKAEPVPSLGGNDNQRTFDAGFGIGLPTKVQLGFVGVTGLPDILPWKDLPLDLWGLIGLIPEVGGTIASAASNIGVYMDSTDACPLGNSAEFHDARDLISVDLKDLITDADTGNKPKDLATRLWDRVPGTVKTVVKNGIKIADMVNDETAQNKAIDLIADGLALVTSAGELTLSADPYWRVQGEKLVVLIRYRIPGKMLSGNVPLTFTAPGQEQDITVPLPAFVNDAHNLEILVDEVEYDFRLYQSMSAQITFSSMVDFSLGDAEKLVRCPQARATFTTANDLHVPLAPPDETIVGYRARPGFGALMVYFSSPALPVKATADVYKGGQKVKSVTESSLRTAHAIIVPGLEENTDYTVRLSYVDSGGNAYDHDQAASCRTKTGDALDYLKTNMTQGDESMTTPNVSVTQTAAHFNWTSTRTGTTFVYISPLDDFNLYTSAIKHVNGLVSVGDCTSEEGNPEMTQNHNIDVPDLEPGTTYQYVCRTWFYDDDDPTDNPDFALAYRGSFTTQAAPPPPQATVQLKKGATPLAGIPLTVTRLSPAPVEHINVVTGSDGKTPVFALTPGGQYRATVTDQACVQDGTATWNAPPSAGSSPSIVQLNLNPRPHPGGFVVDVSGTPLSGASVSLSGKFQATTTSAQGRFAPAGTIPAPGDYALNVTMGGYLPGTMHATVDACGLVSADTCVLTRSQSSVTVRVLRPNNQPLAGAQVQLCLPTQPTSCQPVGGTNSEGIARTIFTFTANETLERLVKVTPHATTPFLPGETTMTLVPGGDNPTVEVYCDAKPFPEITAFAASQKNDRIRVRINLAEQARAGLEYVTPAGQTLTIDPSQTFATSHTLEITGCASGTYRVRGWLYDTFGRPFYSGWQEVRYWSAADWNLQASNLQTTDATLTWSKYDGPAGFKGYVLTVGGQQPLTITNQGSLTRGVNNLTPNQPTTVGIYAKDADGDAMTETAQVTFTTTNQPPTIGDVSLAPNTVAVGQQALFQATISDPDGKLARILVTDLDHNVVYDKKGGGSSTTIKVKIVPDKPGDVTYLIRAEDEYDATQVGETLHVVRIATPEFKSSGLPDQAEILREWKGSFKLLNAEQLSGFLTLSVTWDKEQPAEVALPESVLDSGAFELTRTFDDAGTHRLQLTMTAEAEGLSFTSKPVKAQVKAVENPPQLALSYTGQGPEKVFHVTVTPGSLDIDHWTLDFGNKNLGLQAQGQGPADQDVPYTYTTPPGQKPLKSATATLTAWDVRGKEYKASTRVSIAATQDQDQSSRDDKPEEGLAQTREGASAKDEETVEAGEVEADLLLSASMPSKGVAGQELVIKAKVTNRSKQDLAGIKVALYLDRVKVGTRELDLAAGQKGEVEFTYTPEEATILYPELEATPPKGVTDPKLKNNTDKGRIKVLPPKE